MTRRSVLALMGATWLLAVGHACAFAAETVKYSGTVVAIDRGHGTLVIEEVGPWRVERGATQVIRRTIVLTRQTEFSLFVRVNPPGGFAGAFVEGELAAQDLTPGDYVTAECRLERGRLVAVKVSWADPAEP